MTVGDLSTALGYECVQDQYEDGTIQAGYTSDLLSDVMANCPEDSVLITIQGHKNTVAVATLSGALAVVICNSRPIPEDMVEAARGESLAIFRTEKNQFQVSTEVYEKLRASG
jgi:hypothetical protein